VWGVEPHRASENRDGRHDGVAAGYAGFRRRGGTRYIDVAVFAAPIAPRSAMPRGAPMFRLQVDEHIELRLMVPADAAELFAVTDANRAHLRRWLPWLDTVKSSGDSAAFIQATLRQFSDRVGYTAAIVHDRAIVGVVGHHRISWANRATSLGYWLAAGHEGRGIMTAACRAVVRHAFAEYELNRIEIRCAVGNERSRAIPERLGFRSEGTLREAEWLYDHFVDHVVYGLLRTDPDVAGR
jgi:ribosomal-protein-serine acetyltransferase